VTTCFENLPGDLASAHAMILAQREMLIVATSEAKVRALEIERLKLMLAKARREIFGQSSERGKLHSPVYSARRRLLSRARTPAVWCARGRIDPDFSAL
jgi:hypothetical protein